MTTVEEATYLDRLWQRQEELGWSDRELARRLEISKSQVSDIKRGTKGAGEGFHNAVSRLFPDILAPEKPEIVESTALAQAIDDFLTAKRVDGKSPRTVDDFYAVYLRHFLMWSQENSIPQQPALIKPPHIRAFMAYLQSTVGRWGSDHPVARKEISPGGRHAYYRTLKAFFRWLLRQEYIDRNPIDLVDAPTVPKKKIQIFNLKDIPRMINSYGDDWMGLRNRAMILLFLDTGCRLNELASIEMPKIDFQKQTIEILGKGSKQRTVGFSARTRKVIEDWLPERDKLNKSGSQRLWLTREGRPLGDHQIYGIIRDLAAKVGITGVRCSPHTFRHTCATELLRATRDLYGVRTYMGHSTVKVTEGYLQTFSSEDALQTFKKASLVDGLFEKAEERS